MTKRDRAEEARERLMRRMLAETRMPEAVQAGAKTLRLAEDSKGLHVEADLPETTYGRDLSISMQRGDIYSMSFGFSVRRAELRPRRSPLAWCRRAVRHGRRREQVRAPVQRRGDRRIHQGLGVQE